MKHILLIIVLAVFLGACSDLRPMDPDAFPKRVPGILSQDGVCDKALEACVKYSSDLKKENDAYKKRVDQLEKQRTQAENEAVSEDKHQSTLKKDVVTVVLATALGVMLAVIFHIH